MKYCTNCGKELFDEAVFCPGCGVSCEKRTSATDENDQKSFGWALLCFFIPVLGLILYLVWKDKTPLKAKSCGKGAIVGFVLSTIFSIAMTALSTYFFMTVEDSSVYDAGYGYYDYI